MCFWVEAATTPRRRINHEFHLLAVKPLYAAGGATGWQPEEAGINPAKKLVREHEDLVVSGEVSIVTGRGAIPCSAWSGTVGSKESSDGHRVTRWTF